MIHYPRQRKTGNDYRKRLESSQNGTSHPDMIPDDYEDREAGGAAGAKLNKGTRVITFERN